MFADCLSNQVQEQTDTLMPIARTGSQYDELGEYLDLGLSIIPLKPNSKISALDWGQFQNRLPTTGEVQSWRSAFPNMNVGIVTGAVSDIIVLDLDGDEAFEVLKGFGEIPLTPTVQTAKGKHFYFKHPGSRVGNKTRLRPKVDLRGDHGYVVAPPSIHASGHKYTWEIGLDVPFADVPGWLLELISGTEKKEDQLRDVVGEPSRGTLNEINRIVGELVRASEGSRNDRLYKAALDLGRFVGGGVLQEGEVFAKLGDAARSIGLKNSEIYPTIKSGLKAGITKPRASLGEVYDILDSTPEVIDRPIRLINGTAFGVTWLPVATRESNNLDHVMEPVVFDGRGNFYAERDIPGSKSLVDLGLNIDLQTEVSVGKRISPLGFKRFRRGGELAPNDVFDRLVKSIDAFVSFESSPHEQRAMCEFVACWTLGTYFSEAFDVMGYLWPSGERGSGKTQLLNTITAVAYLGKTVTAGSSFASMRDEAHYGATIAFDDCENVKDMDIPKRELLLSGNTRGEL
jgi:Bifunctional DNA primase/polymerase, N-terminal